VYILFPNKIKDLDTSDRTFGCSTPLVLHVLLVVVVVALLVAVVTAEF
jgi:hypothetical protein